MTPLAGVGFTPQDLGKMAAAQSLANRGITHVFVSSRSVATEVRRKASDRCVSCGVPADHAVHQVADGQLAPSGRRGVRHADRADLSRAGGRP